MLIIIIIVADVSHATGAMTADDCPWSYHPFGRSLVASLFRYYQSLGDIQTLAMLACVLSFSPYAAHSLLLIIIIYFVFLMIIIITHLRSNVVAPSPAPARAMITVQPATSSVASTSTSSFFPSIFRRDQVSSSASADEVPVSTSGGKPHRDLKRELSLGNEVFGGKLKNLKRERVNSSSFISQPSVQSSTGSLSFSNIDSLTSASALSTSPGDSSPPPPPPPPSASMRHYHHDRIAQSGASLTSASSPTLQGTSLTSSVGQLEPLILNSGVGGGDVSTSGGGSSSMLSTASSRLSVGYGRTSSTPNALLSTSPSSPSHMRDAAAREHKRSQSLTSKKAGTRHSFGWRACRACRACVTKKCVACPVEQLSRGGQGRRWRISTACSTPPSNRSMNTTSTFLGTHCRSAVLTRPRFTTHTHTTTTTTTGVRTGRCSIGGACWRSGPRC